MSNLANIDSLMSSRSRRSIVDETSKTNDQHISNGTNNSNTNNDLERSRQSMREKYKDLLMEGVNTNNQSPSRVDRSRSINDIINRTPLYDDKNYINKESSIYKQFKKSLGDKKDGSKISHKSRDNSKYDQLDYLDDSDDEHNDDDYDYEQDDDDEEEEDDNITLDDDEEDYELDSLNDDMNESDFYSKNYETSPFISDENNTHNEDDVYDLEDMEEYDVDGEHIIKFFTWKKLIYFLVGLLIFGYFYHEGNNDTLIDNNTSTNLGGSFRSSPNVGSFTNIQKQINHLYSELSTRDKRWNNEFDEKLKIVISQFEKNIKRLLPPSLLNVESEIKSINTKIQNLQENAMKDKSKNFEFTLTNVTSLQNKLLNELEKELPNEIPVMVNNSSSMLIIPEMHNYISHLLSNLIKYSNITMKESTTESTNNLALNYDLNNYIKEILTNEFQYINKEYFINELNSRLQANKLEILHDLKDNIQIELTKFKGNTGNNNGLPERYSTVLLKRLINQIYDVNQHQWGNDLDFMTFAQGTRLLKSLTSTTSPQGNGIAPMQMLSDNKMDSSSTYWQCRPNGQGQCSLAIRFNKPIHLTKISYLHGRFTNNLHMMNSAPRKISIYIKLNKIQDTTLLQKIAMKFNEGGTYNDDKTFIKIQSYEYDIFSKKIKQNFSLPSWFIQFKPLVKGMIFHIDSNYGNKEYISLKKFIVNGVSESDLIIMKSKSFPMYDYKSNETSSPEYHYDYDIVPPKQQQIPSRSRDIPRDGDNIPSFGDDQKVV